MVVSSLCEPKDSDSGEPSTDRLQVLVHAALAVYLLPAFLLVMLVGGVLLAIGGVARALSWTFGLLIRVRRPSFEVARRRAMLGRPRFLGLAQSGSRTLGRIRKS
ncbi:MAG: hypothetical protein U0794_22055 [Isosphaeraceae bacterium]